MPHCVYRKEIGEQVSRERRHRDIFAHGDLEQRAERFETAASRFLQAAWGSVRSRTMDPGGAPSMESGTAMNARTP